MYDYLVVKILDSQSICIQSTLVYGEVEIRSHKSDSEEENQSLRESAKKNKKEFQYYSYTARIATIVKAKNTDEAIETANTRFSNILDLKSVEFSISNMTTSDIGFTKKLNTGEIKPIIFSQISGTLAFTIDQTTIQHISYVHYILSIDCDLKKRYQRSLHWVKNGKIQNDKQLKILFYWFALEALFKELETDNMGGIARWFLGFPNGRYRNDVSSSLISEISSHPRYSFWNKELILIFDKIRNFRNNSVHSGFRNMDFSKEEVNLYDEIMTYTLSRCQNAVLKALINGIETTSEFKSYIGIIFEENENLINDTHNNIIYSLDRKYK